MSQYPALVELAQAQRGRRAWVLVAIGWLIPGSAQAVYGLGRNRRLGRFAVTLWLTLVALAIVFALLWLVWRQPLIRFFTNPWVVTILLVTVSAIAALWLILALDTIVMARPSGLGRRRGLTFSVVAGLVSALLVVGPVLPVSYLATKTTSTLCDLTNGQGCGLLATIGTVGHVLGGGPPADSLRTDANGRTNVLLLATSDDRPDADGGNGAWLTDSIMVVSVSRTAGNVFMISIPRDLWVTYPANCPFGRQGKINAVYQCDGAGSGNTAEQDQAALTATIPTFETVTGLSIQYAVNINYSVLVALVDAVGGSITVNVVSTDPRGIDDVNTGLKLNPNSAQCPSDATQPMICTIDAETALDLARARNSDGGYGLAASNFNREQNQQAIIVALTQQAQTNGLLANLAGVTTALDGLGANLRSTFAVGDIASLVTLAQGLNSTSFSSLDFIDAQPAIVGTPTIDGQSAVAPLAGTFDYSAIQAWIAAKLATDPASAEGATIDVLNGSGQAGVAASTADDLRGLGYMVGTVGNYTGVVGGTHIWDITDNKPRTSAALAQKYGVSVTPGAPTGYQPSPAADFVIVIGG